VVGLPAAATQLQLPGLPVKAVVTARLLLPAADGAAVEVVAAQERRRLQPAAMRRAERPRLLRRLEPVAPQPTERPPQQTTALRLPQLPQLTAVVAVQRPVAVVAARRPEVEAAARAVVEQPAAVAAEAAAATQPRRQPLPEPRKALWPQHCKAGKQWAIYGVPKALGIHFATLFGCRNRMAASALYL
jgi:hypothetical protein